MSTHYSLQPTTSPIVYSVSGMHCASCEILIEKTILDLSGVKTVNASTSNGQVVVEYEDGKKPDIHRLNVIFKKEKYFFSEGKKGQAVENKESWTNILLYAGSAIILFLGLNSLGFINLINVSPSSSLPIFFIFGLMAGFSTCAALVGGIVLSMSKQWERVVFFNFGRVVGFGFFGGVLGLIGNQIHLSFGFSSFLVIAVSVLMLVLGLQMLGVPALKNFQFGIPKFLTRKAADEKNFVGKYSPILMGALTFFLPCGFTISAQGVALLSGSILGGAAIMMAFAAGTAIPLMLIGVVSVSFTQFSRVAGVIVIFFAIFNINNQLTVLGLPSLNVNPNVGTRRASYLQTEKTKNTDVQIIKMQASFRGYEPNYFQVKAGIPVRWEITDAGTSGCTNAVIARDFLRDPVKLIPGKVSVAEFTPKTPGVYRFSCWMGMVSGSIEVIPYDK